MLSGEASPIQQGQHDLQFVQSKGLAVGGTLEALLQQEAKFVVTCNYERSEVDFVAGHACVLQCGSLASLG